MPKKQGARPWPCITLTLALHDFDLGFAWPWPCTTLTLPVQLVICRKKFTTILCLFQKRSRSRRRRLWWNCLRPPPRQWGHLVASRAAAVCATYWQQRRSWSHRDGAAAMTTWRVVYLSSVADLGARDAHPLLRPIFLKKFICSSPPKLCPLSRGLAPPASRGKSWIRHWSCIWGSECVVTKFENCHWWTIPHICIPHICYKFRYWVWTL